MYRPEEFYHLRRVLTLDRREGTAPFGIFIQLDLTGLQLANGVSARKFSSA
jgi:hypothetical protein